MFGVDNFNKKDNSVSVEHVLDRVKPGKVKRIIIEFD